MKNLILSFLILGTAHGALAGVFEEREDRALQKRVEKPLQEAHSRAVSAEARAISGLQRFIVTHSGAKSDPTCTIVDMAYECPRQRCQSVPAYLWSSEVPASRQAKFSKLAASYSYSVSNCDVELKSGLACRVSLNGYNDNPIKAVCYDANGNQY